MQLVAFNAKCPFEIGDKVHVRTQNIETNEDFEENIKTITDIACVHYVKNGIVEFRYELGGNGVYVPLQITGFAVSKEQN